jgi:hypothetical protein
MESAAKIDVSHATGVNEDVILENHAKEFVSRCGTCKISLLMC